MYLKKINYKTKVSYKIRKALVACRTKNYYCNFSNIYSNRFSDEFDSVLKNELLEYGTKFTFKPNLNILFCYPGKGWVYEHLCNCFNKFGSYKLFEFSDCSIEEQISTRTSLTNNLYSYIKKSIENYDIIFLGGARGHFDSIILKKIKLEFKIPIINFQFDDKQAFSYKVKDKELGSIEAARGCTLTFTNSKYCIDWFLSESCPALYLPEASSREIYFPDNSIEKSIDVAFFGQKYGCREELINRIRSAGIQVEAYGKGWPNSFLTFEEQNKQIQKAKILLSHEGISYSYWPSHIKGKTFDFAMCGSCILTSYSSELADWFTINKEILCYYNPEDAIDIIRYYIKRPEMLSQIGKAAFHRAINEHTWDNRFETVFRLLDNFINSINLAN